MVNSGETEIEDFLDDDLEGALPSTYSIDTYGADYDVSGLVRKLNNNDIIIPEFQRKFVWSFIQASRFIESLLLGLPVPSIFFSVEKDTQKELVIDGQQRLLTLKYYYSGLYEPLEKPFMLRGVQSRFNGLKYEDLLEADKRRLNNSDIHAIIIKQNEPLEDNSSIYHIFERLNTGGTILTSQEIRACIYRGELIDLLEELNNNTEWRKLFGKIHKRSRDQELILRFFALYYYRRNYKSPMNSFLNNYMAANRRLSKQTARRLTRLFETVVIRICQSIGARAFKPKKILNAAIFDSIMVGLAVRMKKDTRVSNVKIRNRYNKLISNSEFLELVGAKTSDVENVKRRIEMAIEAFDKS